MPSISDSDANIASEALVFPVDAHATFFAPTMRACVNAAVIPNFQLYTIEANDGEMLAGILAAQSDTSITLRRAAGEESTVLRRNIKTLTNTKISLLPPGLLIGLAPQQVADLITFIRQSP